MPLLFLSLDNTLLNRAGAFRAWAKGYLAEIGAPDDDLEWLDALDADGLTETWDLADAIKDRYSLRVPAIDVVDAIRDGILAHVRLAPTVAHALRIASHSGYAPVVVTNGESRQQEAKMLRTGLFSEIAAYVISEDVGVRKPNPRIFTIAAERAGVRTLRGSWLIGDSPEADIGGASALAIPSVWIRRGRRWPDDRYAPTHVTDCVIEAVARVLADRD